jgi:hypothetical protein
VAEAVARWLTRRRLKWQVESSPWEDAPYRSTLTVVQGGPTLLIEAQGRLSYHRALADFAAWLMANRHYAELSIAVDAGAEAPVRALEDMKRAGVGLLLVEEGGSVKQAHAPLNPALLVQPDPTLRYGDCKSEVGASVEKFNQVNRKDGLRDMCELVERETEKLALAAVRKGLMSMDEKAVGGMDWSGQINTLASHKAFAPGVPLLDDGLKNDFHSFRGARNLVDHPARSARDNAKRVRQFAERMAQGPRLVAELVSLRRKVNRQR